MKLKNKKTGENYETTMPIVFNIKTSDGGEHTVSCESIKELNEKWEDCNGYYYIGDGGDVNLSRMKMIWFYDNYNDGQDHKFIVGDKLYKTLLKFHTKSSECKEIEGGEE